MNDADALLTIAEVAVGFMGFASIVSVLARGLDGAVSLTDAVRLRGMLFTGLAVVAGCFIPFATQRLALSPLIGWRIASLAWLAVVGAALIGAYRDVRRLDGEPLSPLLGFVIVGLLLGALVLAVMNALSVFPAAAPGLHLISVLCLLTISGTLFARAMSRYLAGSLE